MIKQIEFTLQPFPRGIHIITGDVMRYIARLPDKGLLNLMIKHTSAALAINENADPDVRHDLNSVFDRLVPENAPYYLHTDEGPDDMPSHAKSIIVGASLTVPITEGRLNLGIWQGLYLCEFRDHGGPRRIVATIIGE
ncbi:MAG: secondary thiamine-phosphate synthase enzyme YjbQ [Muribaculaceae bacterium]|nr:secondary thiamine-phosphate synthase enzyme YjbQ [Muribaculaceae bacterium]